MPALFRRRVSLALFAFAAFGLIWTGCGASSDDAASHSRGNGGSTGAKPPVIDSGQDEYVLTLDAPNGGADGAVTMNPLCGVLSQGCIPDRPEACVGHEPSSAGQGGGGAGGTAAGLAGQAGQGETPEGGARGLSGAGGEGGVSSIVPQGGAGGSTSGAAGESGHGSLGGESGAGTAYGCQVKPTSSGVRAECAEAGSGEVNAPCFSSRDCRPGLGCVGDGGSGRCLPFCCAGEKVCAKGTYCADRPLRDEGQSEDTKTDASVSVVLVPVCAPADDCRLSDPYPCPSGKQCTCPDGKACLAVGGPEPTTTCKQPGTGVANQSCPCAWGHVCSQATGKCIKLCQTSLGKADCAGGECQASAELPDGWGVCVGSSADAG